MLAAVANLVRRRRKRDVLREYLTRLHELARDRKTLVDVPGDRVFMLAVEAGDTVDELSHSLRLLVTFYENLPDGAKSNLRDLWDQLQEAKRLRTLAGDDATFAPLDTDYKRLLHEYQSALDARHWCERTRQQHHELFVYHKDILQ